MAEVIVALIKPHPRLPRAPFVSFANGVATILRQKTTFHQGGKLFQCGKAGDFF
jgi:hypothetical protein